MAYRSKMVVMKHGTTIKNLRTLSESVKLSNLSKQSVAYRVL